MPNKAGYFYLLANKTNSVIYAGVTSNLKKRVYEHREKFVDGFCERYRINKLVYYECFDSTLDAIEREKQIKAGPRKQKMNLIGSMNPRFEDLYASL